MLPVTSLQHRYVKSMSNLNVNRILNYSLCSLAPLTYSSVWSESQSFSRIYQKKVACPFPSSAYPFFSSVPKYWQSDWKVGHNFVLIYGQFLIQLQGTADDTESWLAASQKQWITPADCSSLNCPALSLPLRLIWCSYAGFLSLMM